MDAPFDILGLAMDAIGASLPQFVVPVAFYGMRPEDRKVALTLNCVVVEGSPLVMQDAAAPTDARTFTVTLTRRSWCLATPPQIGDWAKMHWSGADMWLKASAVNHLPSGDIALVAEWKPGRVPQWSR